MKVTYIGPHDAANIFVGHDVREDLDHLGWVTVANGETVDLPAWKCEGAPALPGVALVDGAEVPFDYGDDPPGPVVVPAVPPISGLLDQPDNWVPAKSRAKSEPSPEPTKGDES